MPEMPHKKIATLKKKEVFHVGYLSGKAAKKALKERAWSLEGWGLSVSENPAAWARIAKLGGDLFRLRRKDGRPGRFVDLTGDKAKKHAALALSQGLLRKSALWRVSGWTEDEEPYFSDYASREEATDAAEGDAVKKISGFVATPKLRKAWGESFKTELEANPIDMAVMYALEESSTDIDGAWWNEELAPEELSAPRGVIFRSSLPEWEFKEVGWEEAPYGEEY
jgi:hypothetical protein